MAEEATENQEPTDDGELRETPATREGEEEQEKEPIQRGWRRFLPRKNTKKDEDEDDIPDVKPFSIVEVVFSVIPLTFFDLIEAIFSAAFISPFLSFIDASLWIGQQFWLAMKYEGSYVKSKFFARSILLAVGAVLELIPGIEAIPIRTVFWCICMYLVNKTSRIQREAREKKEEEE